MFGTDGAFSEAGEVCGAGERESKSLREGEVRDLFPPGCCAESSVLERGVWPQSYQKQNRKCVQMHVNL